MLFLQLPESPVAELTNSLPSYSHHPADLFQRPAVAIIQTEIKPEHLGVARWQGCQCQLEIVRPAARQRRGVGPLLSERNESVQPASILPFPHGLVQTQCLDMKRTE